ncbi:MAG: hypothetical protein M1837_002723 [Sclerophora amabilis]|nr:MAG: hypothetical protein M1837_002723 [Sclerophora amabilis]
MPVAAEAFSPTDLSQMAAFSRGCIHSLRRHSYLDKSPVSPHLAFSTLQRLRTQLRSPRRFLSFSPSLSLAAKRRRPRPPPTTAPVNAHQAPPPQTQTFAEVLASRSSPTLLYHAPQHTAYILGSYTFGGFCISYAGVNLYTHYLFPPEDLPVWVPIAFGGVCFFMACFGTWLILGPSRIIRSLSAVPKTRASESPSLNIQIELLPVLPFFTRPRYQTLPPASVTLSNRLFNPLQSQHARAAAHSSRKEAVRAQEAEMMYERDHIMSAPFRHFSQACFRMVTALRRVWTKEGFTKMRVQGRTAVWRLDGNAGWMLDEGRAVDRLIKVKNT